jgi:molybdate transport system substrate-binding protein
VVAGPCTRLGLALLLVGLASTGCAQGPPAGRATMVFAAASLSAPFQALAREFEGRHRGERLDLHFAGTPQLVLQIDEGAPADVFASADEANMRRIVDEGHVQGPPRVFARNRLTIVTARANPLHITGLADLARDDLTVVLCAPEVPAGRYARRALETAGVRVRPVSDEPSVNAVVSKIRLGEADAGIVYVTDTLDARGAVDAVPVPDAQNVVATYPIAILRTGTDRSTAEAFVAFVLSPAGQDTLRSFGFEAP